MEQENKQENRSNDDEKPKVTTKKEEGKINFSIYLATMEKIKEELNMWKHNYRLRGCVYDAENETLI